MTAIKNEFVLQVLVDNPLSASEHVAPQVAQLLKDEVGEVRKAAAKALSQMGPLGMEEIPDILGLANDHSAYATEYRFFAHLLGGGREDLEILIAAWAA